MIRNPRLLYSAAQVRELDRIAIEEHGIDGYVLMCRAGESAFRYLRERWPGCRRLRVLCGSGNNGGDGYVVARLALESDLEPEVIALGEARSATAQQACADYVAAGGRISPGGNDPGRGGTRGGRHAGHRYRQGSVGTVPRSGDGNRGHPGAGSGPRYSRPVSTPTADACWVPRCARTRP